MTTTGITMWGTEHEPLCHGCKAIISAKVARPPFRHACVVGVSLGGRWTYWHPDCEAKASEDVRFRRSVSRRFNQGGGYATDKNSVTSKPNPKEKYKNR